MPVSPRTRFDSTWLVRSLAGLGVADVVEPAQTFAERLTPWLAWPDAIALSAALDGPGGRAAAGTLAPAAAGATAAARAAIAGFHRERAELLRAVDDLDDLDDAATAADRRGRAPVAEAAGAPDAGPVRRRRHLERQQALAPRVGALRRRMRAALAAHSAELGRLAAIDAVLDDALAPRERQLLSTVPRLLERAAARRPAAEAGPSGAAAAPTALRQLLRAELQARLLPVEGMVEALGAALADDARDGAAVGADAEDGAQGGAVADDTAAGGAATIDSAREAHGSPHGSGGGAVGRR